MDPGFRRDDGTASHARQRLVIYTALVGPKEQLGNPLAALPAGATSDLDLDFVCLTDNPLLRSDVWRMQLMPSSHVPAEKLSRRPKALPHEYFPDAAFSLYIDNTVSFKRLPQAADLTTHRPRLFRAFRHATRVNPQQEATAVAALGYDDVSVICNQLDFYAARRPLATITPLTTATVLLRSHHDPAIKRFGVTWWESILAFSKRDQLSFDFALLESACGVEYFDGFTHDNPLIHWRGSVSPHRVKASFDAKRYAWHHRADAQAQSDPKAHFLAHGGGNDRPYLKPGALLEFLCHAQGSSLGGLVSPRRAMADALEALLAPHRAQGQRYLLARVQGASLAQAFDATELNTAAAALSAFLGPAKGTLIDLPAADLNADGKVYTTEQAPYDLVIVLGAAGEQLTSTVQKLQRLMNPVHGRFVAALATPAALQGAAAAEGWLQAQFSAGVSTSLHASSHDDLVGTLPNTVVGIEWQHATLAKVRPQAALTPPGVPA